MALCLGTAAASAAADAVTALLDGGYLRLYGGTMPESDAVVLEGQPLLAELIFGDPAFTAAQDGLAEAYPLKPERSAPATGTATWFWALKADGVTPILCGTVGTSQADLILNDTQIQAGAAVQVTTFQYVQPQEAE